LSADPTVDPITLLDWRRRIGDLYSQIRAMSDKRAARDRWQETRVRLFREHPQSPVPAADRDAYHGPHVYGYDPTWSLVASVEPADFTRVGATTSTAEVMTLNRFGLARFVYAGVELTLELYWLEGYGGGLFLPFADATNGGETYGGGRYLLDTVKGADLGQQNGLLVVDFNFAYQPSCAYDPRWTCPLTPPANRLAVPVRAGERVDPDSRSPSA
jgi:uncharacterized protein